MRTLLAAALLLAAAAARADGPIPLRLAAGTRLELCREKLLACPGSTPLCDAPNVAVIELGKTGPELKGVGPGTTTCSVRDSNNLRRIFRVTVEAPAAAGGGQGAAPAGK